MLHELLWAFYSRALLSCFLNPCKLLGSTKNSTVQLGNIWRNLTELFCFVLFCSFLFCFALFCYSLFCMCLNLPPVSLGQLSYSRCLNWSKQNFPLKALKRQRSWWFNELNSELLLCFVPETEIQTRGLCQGAGLTARIIYHLCLIFWIRVERAVLMWQRKKKCLCCRRPAAKRPRYHKEWQFTEEHVCWMQCFLLKESQNQCSWSIRTGFVRQHTYRNSWESKSRLNLISRSASGFLKTVWRRDFLKASASLHLSQWRICMN